MNGVLQSGNSDTLAGPIPVGYTVECSATPNDGFGSGSTVSASAVVSNTLPVVDSVTLDSGVILSDGTVTATASVSDVDGTQSISANYEWFVNGISVQNGSDATLDGSEFVKGDYIYVEVTPNDGVEDGASLSSSFIVIGNTVPSNQVVSVTSSDNFNNDSNVTCSASVDDLDVDENVDSLSYTYTWSTGDTGSTLDLAYVNFLSPGSITPGDSITCDVTVTDGDDSVSGSDSQGIGNRTPVVDSVVLSQSVTAETSSLVCDATGSDPDGDSVSLAYEWTVGGVVHPEVSDTLTDIFVVGTTIECSVTPSDSTESGTPVTASTTVLNTLPVVDSVTLDSNVILSDSTVTATASLSDVDGTQSVSANYEWFVNGSSVQNGSSMTLDGANFVKGDEVYVVVTPNDGVEDGNAVTSTSITIGNTAPSIGCECDVL